MRCGPVGWVWACGVRVSPSAARTAAGPARPEPFSPRSRPTLVPLASRVLTEGVEDRPQFEFRLREFVPWL